MRLKETKQPIMGLAALLILFYHLYPIPRNDSILSVFLRYVITTSYIGVDLFFFLAGYMSFFSALDDNTIYIRKKLIRIYPLFIISCAIFVFMGKISLPKALLTLLGIELFSRGGGSFLWFLPAIMIFYLTVPLYKKLQKKFGSFPVLLFAFLAWLMLILLLEKTVSNHSINIFMCRVPIIMLGIALAKYEGKWQKGYQVIVGILLLCSGVLLAWQFSYPGKTDFLISDIFYILTIPYVLGVVLLADIVFSVGEARIFAFLGKITLELYCFQMLFGTLFFEWFIVLTKNGFLSFALGAALIALISYLWSLVYRQLQTKYFLSNLASKDYARIKINKQ
ncbi:MAG TPA: acyltransferase [Clostridiaceae bacterium]|nr:acyltransferase [Clostridiaceae bacterium]